MEDSKPGHSQEPQQVKQITASPGTKTASKSSSAESLRGTVTYPFGSEQPVIEADPETLAVENDTDSTFGHDSASSTQSMRPSQWDYTYENGRRYHSYGSTPYFSPNDEPENDRLDICAHMFSLLMDGELHYAPIGNDPQRILDLGTGTGIWAIDMADKYPSAFVIGNDISPVQTNVIPPNLQFEVDDIEQEWQYSYQFDFIHCRYLNGAIRDWPKLVQQAFKYTKPGGWVEFMDFTMTFYTNNGEFKPGCAIDMWTRELKAWLASIGVEAEPGPKLKGWITDAGFENIHERNVALPVGMWPKDKKFKEIGTFNLIQFLENLEGFSLRAMTSRGWDIDEIKVFLATVRNEFKNPKFRMQHDGYIIWAQKPAK
ncbi:uncharacterized protein PV09_00944 [Verruconis gallopava]|uniref:Methyltransferase domain-containing protein n=1 Tax=Verruconis gallopava TaxID=253628 RepID=A0A0D2AMT4_9PEZI|nr:uncharacterized protein PV09_00944 [Verruconis gallopava]KIW07998.1 hypothetical protein PV09_00944 [Verruconis gallopava]